MLRFQTVVTATSLFFLCSVALAESGGEFLPSGVSTEAIQLPQSAGSIQGFDKEAASVGNTGALNYAVPIQVPKGRNGLQPDLSLTYSSAAGEGAFGIGWKIDFPFVERSTIRGVPQYTTSDLMNSSEDGELVPTGGGGYRPLIDKSQSWYAYQTTGDSWTRLQGNGLVHTFGGRSDARIVNASGTFQWLISTTQDSFGNRVEYFYTQNEGQTYLSQVKYVFTDGTLTSNLYSIQFTYGARSDVLTGYKSTYPVTTALLCTDIRVESHVLIRHYKLGYDQTPNGKLSRLKTVDLFGTDDTTQYPTVTFTYSQEQAPQGNTSQQFQFNSSFPQSFANPIVTFADLNGDSIPDIIQTSETGAQVWLGNGDGSYQAPYTLSGVLGALGGKNLRLMDVDGDRNVDLVGSGLYPKYWPGDGNGGFNAPIDITHFPRYSVGSPQVRTFDVNGDGKMDLIAQEPDAIRVFFNQGGGSWGQEAVVPNDAQHVYPIFDFSSPKTFFVDMNGDGLTDIAYVDANRIYYYPSLGNGQWAPMIAMNFAGVDYQNTCTSPGNCPDAPEILKSAQLTKNVFLMDINSDGLADLVVVFPNEVLFAYNQGDGTFGLTQTIQNVHSSAMDQNNLAIATADVNANGSQDLVWSNDDGDFRYFDFTAAGKPNLLTGIDNGLGKTTTVSYLPHTKFAASTYVTDGGKIPFVVHAVNDIKVQAWGQAAAETQYNYSGPYYNGARNEFRGFQVVEKTLLGDDSVPDYLQRQIFEVGKTPAQDQVRGQLLSQEERRAATTRGAKKNRLPEGPILASEAHQYTIFPTSTSTLDGESPALPLETSSSSTEGDEYGSAPRAYSIATSYTLGQGAILSSIASTYDTTPALYRSTQDTYAVGAQFSRDSIPTLWNVANIAERDLKDASGNVVKSTRLYYDQSTTLGQVTQGKVSRVDQLSGTNYVTKKSFTWTTDGNLASFSDAASHQTQITYDTGYRLLATQIVNPASQTQSATYNFDLGVMTSKQDVNSNSNYFTYEPLLRLSSLVGPIANGGTPDYTHPTLQSTYTFGDDIGDPGKILTQRLTDLGETTSISSTSYFDPLGRAIATITQGPTGQYTHSGGSVYNSHSKVKKKYRPFFVSDFTQWALNSARPFTQTNFDVLDRATQITNPQNTVSVPSLKQFTYKVGETDKTDENNHTNKKNTDYLGRLVSWTDALNNETAYTYTLSDQIAQITDAKSELTIFGYDSLDRRTCKVDPNVGKSSYQYNDLDLVTQKSDYGFDSSVHACSDTSSNTPRTTTYQYSDSLNRLTSKTYSDSHIGPISLSYDSGVNGVGKLTGASYGIGSKALSYDIYGNLKETDFTTSGTAYSIVEKRDVLGRIREVDYPADGNGLALQVGYLYGLDGNVTQVYNLGTTQVYANNFQYNEMSQLHSLQFGNNVVTRMDYDQTLGSYRLTDILTYSGTAVTDSTPVNAACSASGVAALQCLAYQYDNASNVTGMTDYLGSNGKTFSYDNANQLLEATGPWGEQDFAYDVIGNISSKTSTTRMRSTGVDVLDRVGTKLKSKIPGARDVSSYSYDPSRQQILTAVGGTTYQFDLFGALKARGSSDQFIFDAENELAEYDGSTVTEHYYYDEKGNRVEKSNSSGNVFTDGKYFEKTPQYTHRSIFAGSRKIAVLSDATSTIQYIHPDHLSSDVTVTDSSANLILSRQYAPFGEQVSQSGSFTELKEGFTDKYLDAETGLNYFGARYFMPGVGRWASGDKVFNSKLSSKIYNVQGLRLWDYSANNPITLVDENGDWGINFGFTASFSLFATFQVGGGFSYSEGDSGVSQFGGYLSADIAPTGTLGVNIGGGGQAGYYPNAQIIDDMGGKNVSTGVMVPVPGTDVSVSGGPILSRDGQSIVGYGGSVTGGGPSVGLYATPTITAESNPWATKTPDLDLSNIQPSPLNGMTSDNVSRMNSDPLGVGMDPTANASPAVMSTSPDFTTGANADVIAPVTTLP
jgi:RHS repeat-associated protein